MLQGPGTERSAEEAGRDDFTVTEGAVRRFIIDCNLNTKAANCLLGSGLPLYVQIGFWTFQSFQIKFNANLNLYKFVYKKCSSR